MTKIGTLKFIEPEELEKLVRNEKFIYIFGKIGPPRPGVMLFSTKLEYLYFPPGTKKNEDFNCYIMGWQNIDWLVMSIPRDYMNLAKQLVKESGLRIVEGAPRRIINRKSTSFPLRSSNLFTLESIPRQIHEGLKDYREIILEEFEKVKSIERDYLSKNEEKQEKEKPKPVKIIWDEE